MTLELLNYDPWVQSQNPDEDCTDDHDPNDRLCECRQCVQDALDDEAESQLEDGDY